PIGGGEKGEGAGIPVMLKVYDAAGREAVTLVNGRKDPGTYSVVWNAAGFASGTYYYTLTAGGSSITRKMLLVK
ncbi:MAG: T9SS type A sorting domain-containing protein, partial [Bacteroidota bacterium]